MPYRFKINFTFWSTLDEHLVVTAVLRLSIDRHGFSVSGEFKSKFLVHKSSDLSIGSVASLGFVQSAHISAENVHFLDKNDESGLGGFSNLFVNFLVDVVVDGGVVAHAANHGEFRKGRIVGAVDSSAVERNVAAGLVGGAGDLELVKLAGRGAGSIAEGEHLDAGHLVGSQSSSFVGANDGSAAKSLDGRKRSDDRVLFSHSVGAEGEAGRDDSGETFWDGSDGKSNGDLKD